MTKTKRKRNENDIPCCDWSTAQPFFSSANHSREYRFRFVFVSFSFRFVTDFPSLCHSWPPRTRGSHSGVSWRMSNECEWCSGEPGRMSNDCWWHSGESRRMSTEKDGYSSFGIRELFVIRCSVFASVNPCPELHPRGLAPQRGVHDGVESIARQRPVARLRPVVLPSHSFRGGVWGALTRNISISSDRAARKSSRKRSDRLLVIHEITLRTTKRSKPYYDGACCALQVDFQIQRVNSRKGTNPYLPESPPKNYAKSACGTTPRARCSAATLSKKKVGKRLIMF